MKSKTMTFELKTNVFTDPVTITTKDGKAGIIFGIAEAIADNYQVEEHPVAQWNSDAKDADLLSLSIKGVDGDGDDFTLTMTRK